MSQGQMWSRIPAEVNLGTPDIMAWTRDPLHLTGLLFISVWPLSHCTNITLCPRLTQVITTPWKGCWVFCPQYIAVSVTWEQRLGSAHLQFRRHSVSPLNNPMMLMYLPACFSHWTACQQRPISEAFCPIFSIKQIKCVAAQSLLEGHTWKTLCSGNRGLYETTMLTLKPAGF